jgi:hypothetical protein
VISLGFIGDGSDESRREADAALEYCKLFSARIQREVDMDSFYPSEGPPEDLGKSELQVDYASSTPFGTLREGRLYNSRPRFVGEPEDSSDEEAPETEMESTDTARVPRENNS